MIIIPNSETLDAPNTQRGPVPCLSPITSIASMASMAEEFDTAAPATKALPRELYLALQDHFCKDLHLEKASIKQQEQLEKEVRVQ